MPSEKVNKIFHHLVNEKGLSVNAIDETVVDETDTPLHYACSRGSIFVVEWLVEHNASVNSVNRVRRFRLRYVFIFIVSSVGRNACYEGVLQSHRLFLESSLLG